VTRENAPTPLTTEIAQRMYAAGQQQPGEAKDQVRIRYETMATEARTVISERLSRYLDSVARLCQEKRHVGSTPPSSDGRPGTPCSQCRVQIRHMRTALKVITPTPGE